MPITEARLSELNNIAAGTPNGCTFDLDIVEAHALLGELTAWRRKYPTVSTASAVETQLRSERAALQSENHTLRGEHERHVRELNERHDRAMEIVGERIGEIAQRLDRYDKLLARLDTIDARYVNASDLLDALRRPLAGGGEAAFPTGAATTVDEVLAAMPAEPEDDPNVDPPRRGDRVRLEGVRSVGGFFIRDGWYDTVGQRGDAVGATEFQIADHRANGGTGLYWVRNDSQGLKEVRRGAAQLD